MTYRAPLTSSQYLIMTNPHPEIPFLRVGDIIRQSRITAGCYEPTKGSRNRLIPFDIISRYCFEPVEVINNPATFRCFSIRELVNNTGYISDKGLNLLESLVKHTTDKRPVWDIKTLSAYECALADNSTEMYMEKLENIARERMGKTEEIKDKDLWDL